MVENAVLLCHIPYCSPQAINQRNRIIQQRASLLTGEINKDELFSLPPC